MPGGGSDGELVMEPSSGVGVSGGVSAAASPPNKQSRAEEDDEGVRAGGDGGQRGDRPPTKLLKLER